MYKNLDFSALWDCDHWPTKVMRRRRRRRATIIECLHEVPTFKCLTLVVRRPLPTKASGIGQDETI